MNCLVCNERPVREAPKDKDGNTLTFGMLTCETCDAMTPQQKLNSLVHIANGWLDVAGGIGLGFVIVASHPSGLAVTMCNVEPKLAKVWLRDASMRPDDSFVTEAAFVARGMS